MRLLFIAEMRFLSAQLVALPDADGRLALANGRHANAMAARLDAGLRALGVVVPHSTRANAVFPIFSPGVILELQQSFRFYVWNQSTGQIRLMCAWDTTEDDVDSLLAVIKTLLLKKQPRTAAPLRQGPAPRGASCGPPPAFSRKFRRRASVREMP